MANIPMMCLAEIVCEIPPSSLYSELPIQERLVTAGMNTSGLSVNGPAVVPNSTQATKISRVLATYHGVVPQNKQTVVVGMHADPNDQSRAANVFRRARETVQTEKYGPNSFIQQFIPGKVSSEDFLVQQTNLRLEAKAREFHPPNETQAQTNSRMAERQGFLDAMASGERLWVNTYELEYRKTVAALPAARGLERTRLTRKAELYHRMKDNPPRCAVDLNTLHSRQQCDQAKMIPLGLRNWELILDFWQATITDDILTSHLEKASNVVDIRRMLERNNVPDFKDMQGNLWINACALIDLHIVGPNQSKRREMLLDDRSRRMAAYDLGSWSDRKSTCLTRIRALHIDLKFHEDPEFGTWTETPVLIPGSKGRKRPMEEQGLGST
ncbi:hypothetical protein AA0117_g10307 [Alternaria alternata]|uniref:Uncharacterized protein n=1 Tax=Alternaria alternata TaxID=5599 RepID=A0A4Q4N6H1_ALTAL|nr:hypothetical protein AA0117_g10307 [Alternaria alternata]